MAQFRINQATPGVGIPGRTRHDLVAGEIITLVATSPTGPGVSYEWEILDKAGSSATLSASTGASVTIGNAGAITRPSSFLVQLTANDNGVITVDSRIASVRTENASLRIPLFPESAPQSGTLSSNIPDLSHDNASYANRAGTGASGQNWRGWAEWAYEITVALDAAAGGTGINELTGDVIAGPGSGSVATTIAALQGNTLNAATPNLGDALVFDGTEWVPSPMGGAVSLQAAYTGGNTITEAVAGGVLIAQGSGSPMNNYVMRLTANVGSGSVSPLQAQRDPASSASGAGINVYMGVNATGAGIEISHLGGGVGVSVATTGSGNGILVDTTSGSGDGVTVLVPSGSAAFRAQIDSVNALTVDGGSMIADFGAAAAPIDIIGYGSTRMGGAAGSTAKTFELFTTDVATTPATTNKLGRAIAREGIRTTSANVAELAWRSGSGGEVQVTKGGRVYAQNTIFEVPIEDGVTISAGQAVNVSSAAGRVSLSDTSTANEYCQLGICLVGGTGDAGGNVYALVAQSGVVTGLSGLTAQRPVYLDPSTPGGLTTTKPVTGALIVAGFSLSTTAMVVQFALDQAAAGGVVGPSTCIFVDPAGSDGTGARGDASKPFQTISGAFSASGITAGDCIVLSPGVHSVTTTPSPPNVTSISVIGYGSDVTRLDCAFGVQLFDLDYTHTLQHSLVCQGFTIAGNTSNTSIAASGAGGSGNYMLGGVTLRDIRFTKNGTPNPLGFELTLCARVIIENVIVENSCVIDTCIGAPSSVVLASVINGLTVVGNLTYAWDDDEAAGLASPLVRTEVELRDVKVGTILLDGQPYVTFDRACVATNITSLNPLGVSATDVAVFFTFRGRIPFNGGGNGLNLTGAQAILDDSGMGGGIQQVIAFDGATIANGVLLDAERVASANGRSALAITNLSKGSLNRVSAGEGVDATVLGWKGGSFNPGVQLVTSGSGTLTPGSIILNGVLTNTLGVNSVNYGFTAAGAPNFALLGPRDATPGLYVASLGATLVQIYNPSGSTALCDVQVYWVNGG